EKWIPRDDGDRFGPYEEVYPLDPWNYGLLESAIADPATGFQFIQTPSDPLHPWSVEHAPVEIKTYGKIIPDWKLYREMPGPLPHSLPLQHQQDVQPEEITLIPYGCTKLRITEFPVVK
ncbi:MAG: hypothetical protein AMS27_15800, partial [Bacteroides sp. SM23_62_1]